MKAELILWIIVVIYTAISLALGVDVALVLAFNIALVLVRAILWLIENEVLEKSSGDGE